MVFNEVGRVAISDKTEVVISNAVENGKKVGITINKFITTDRYTGYGKGIMIPAKDVKRVIKLLGGA